MEELEEVIQQQLIRLDTPQPVQLLDSEVLILFAIYYTITSVVGSVIKEERQEAVVVLRSHM